MKKRLEENDGEIKMYENLTLNLKGCKYNCQLISQEIGWYNNVVIKCVSYGMRKEVNAYIESEV